MSTARVEIQLLPSVKYTWQAADFHKTLASSTKFCKELNEFCEYPTEGLFVDN